MASGGDVTRGADAPARLNPPRRPPIGRRPRTITTPSGGVIGVGPPPRSYVVNPRPSGCVQRADGGPRIAPPKPGLAARLEGDYQVAITWTLPDLPPACRPDRVRVTVYVYGEPAGPHGETFSVAGTRGTVRPTIPRGLRRYLYQPEVATAAMYAGHSGGLTSVVRIARPG